MTALVLIVLLLLVLMVVVVVIAVGLGARSTSSGAGSAASAGRPTPSATLPPQAAQLPPHVADEITREIEAGRMIQAIKVYRSATGVKLKDAKWQVEHWDPAAHAPVADAGSAAAYDGSGSSRQPADELAVAARAVRDASGWHTAEAYLREQRGLTAEQARAVLDALGPS